MSEGLNLDTNTIILRTILAVTPGTNVPISSGYILASGPGGLMSFTDPLSISSIYVLSSVVATIPSTISTSSGPYNAFFTGQLSTLSSIVATIPSSLSTSFATLPNTVTQITAGTNISLSPAGGTGNVTINAITSGGGTGVTSTNLTSSIIGLGTVGYISSFTPLYSTVRGLGTAGYISTGQLFSTTIGLTAQIAVGGSVTTANLTSTIVGLGTAGYISTATGGITTANLVSSVGGLGSAGYISTAHLFSTTIGLTAQIAANGGGGITTANLVSSVGGLGNAGYISTGQLFSTTIGLTAQIAANGGGGGITSANLANLVSTANLANLVSTANLAGHVSTANLANLVSTSYLTTQFNSTVTGLGTAGYISSAHLFSTSIGLTAQIAAAGSGITPTNLISTVDGLGTAGYISSVNVTNFVSTANLSGLVSTANLSGLVSTANLANLISTTYLTTQLNSTIAGLGTAGYLSSIRSSQLSTGFISVSSINFYDIASGYGVNYMTISTGFLLINGAPISGGGGGGAVSQLIGGTNITLSPIAGTGVVTISMPSTFLNTNNLNSNITSSIIGLGTIGYVSTSQLLSTSYGLSAGGIGGTSITSTVAGLGTAGYVSTSQIVSTVVGLGTAGYVSTTSLRGLISTANLANMVSTSYLTNGFKFSSFSNESARLNFSSLYVNNAPILFDQYGNLALSFQTL